MSKHGVHASGSSRRRRRRGRGGRSGGRGGGRARAAVSTIATVSTRVAIISNLKDLDIGLGALGGGDDTERGAISLGSILSGHLVDLVLSGVDGTRQSVTVGSLVTDDSNTPVGQGVSEGGGGLKVDGVPGDLDKGISVAVLVGSSNVGRPVTPGVVEGSPYTGGGGVDSGRVDVEVGSGSGPVVGIGDGEDGGGSGPHLGGDQHGLVTWQNRLAERDLLAALVSGHKGAGSLVAAGLVGEGLLHLSVLVAEHASVHGQRVGVGGGLGVPLTHELAGGAGVGAVFAGLAGLVRRHGPSGVFSARVHRHKALVGGEGALASSFLVLVVGVSGVFLGDGSSMELLFGHVDGVAVAQNAHFLVELGLVEQQTGVAGGGAVGGGRHVSGIMVGVVGVAGCGVGCQCRGHQGY